MLHDIQTHLITHLGLEPAKRAVLTWPAQNVAPCSPGETHYRSPFTRPTNQPRIHCLGSPLARPMNALPHARLMLARRICATILQRDSVIMFGSSKEIQSKTEEEKVLENTATHQIDPKSHNLFDIAAADVFRQKYSDDVQVPAVPSD
ncbi:unnamed protein product [Vicia faba]|uniref:Uncharacterized protein n=1 Tax=Vicia faba TaxID=3906 RepID=A0AAV1AAZ4_VICFA|nr:unnamed protein product [Vicia faba]